MRWGLKLPIELACDAGCYPGATSRRQRSVAFLRSAATALVIAGTTLNCGGPESEAGNPAQSDEQRSRAEYDVARDLWLRQGNARQALERALRAVELDEEHAEAAHLVALLFLDFCRKTSDECRLPEAEQYARQAIEARADFREARNTLAVVLIHQKRYPEAIAILTPLTQDILYQTPENAWGNLGWAYLESGQLDAAIEALRRSIAAQPAFCVGHYRLGQAYERKKQPGLALEAYGRAVDPEYQRCQGLQDAFAARGRILVNLSRSAEARKDLLRCVQLDKQTSVGRQCASLLAGLD